MGKLILTYHPARLDANSRAGADLIALRADLDWLAAHSVPLRPLDRLLDPACERGVAITFDDGSRIDAEPIDHPRLGRQPSALSILAEFAARFDTLQVASFVIASPQARADLSAGLLEQFGPELMHDRWWPAAAASGLLTLENHSWDHNHPLVAHSRQRDNARGGFGNIDTEFEADGEIAAASDYIEAAVGRRPRYFAYPYGESSAFLRDDYLPRRGASLGLQAAFSTEPRALRSDDSRWHLPRFVSGRDWVDDDGLRQLIGRWL